MTNILDHFENSMRNKFCPANPDEYFALRLASRLGEPKAASHYAILASQHSQERLISVFGKTMKCGRRHERPGQVFHDYLQANGSNGNGGIQHPRLIAVRVERRTVAVAVFAGTHLEGRRVLQLSSNPIRAEASAASFVRAVLSESDCESAAIETAPGDADVLRAILHRAVVSRIRASGIPLWEISKMTLLTAFGHPPLRSRGDLRQIILTIWPLPNIKRSEICALDAFALG